MKADHRAPLRRRRVYGPGLFSVSFHAPELARSIRPGQFLMLEVPGLIRPYLRRAYSVADVDTAGGEVELLVRAIGAGTSALEAQAEGSVVGLLGPLGNGFGIEGVPAGGRVAIVAGGIGAAPFPFLLRALREAGISSDLYLGARCRPDLAIAERFAGVVDGDTVLATDDGSQGERGRIPEVFDRAAAKKSYARVYACGPMPMFRALASVVAKRSIPAEFSTEAEMGCGFGACLGCVIPATDKPFLVSCVDGPILSPERIRW